MVFESFVAWRYLRVNDRRKAIVTTCLGLGLILGCTACFFWATKLPVPHPLDLMDGAARDWPRILRVIGLCFGGVGSLFLVFGLVWTFLSLFTTIPAFGIFLGTGSMVFALSIMNGFEVDLRQKILGYNAHILLSPTDGMLSGWTALQSRVDQVPGVVSSSPTLSSEVLVAANQNYAGVVIKGVDPATVGRVTELEQNLERGGPITHLWPLSEDGLPQPYGVDGGGPETEVDEPLPPEGLGAPPADFSGEAPAPSGLAPSIDADPAPRALDARALDRAPAEFAGTDDADDATAEEANGRRAADDTTAEEANGRRDADDTTAEEANGRRDAEDAAFGTARDPRDRARRPTERDPLIVDLDDAGPVPDVPPLGKLDGEIRGIDGDDALDVIGADMGDLPHDTALDGLDGMIVGRELARNLHLWVGQEVQVVSPLGQMTPAGMVPRTRRFRVAGIYFSGMYEYDSKYVYVTIPALQRFLDLGDVVNGIEVKTPHMDKTEPVTRALESSLGPTYRVQDWRQLNRNLFAALKLEKIAMFLVLTLILLVASFSIVSNLIMVVIEKAREVAILKSMGASSVSILRIFMLEGVYIGVVGTVLGVSLGLLSCWAAGRFALPIDPDVYYIDRLPVAIEPAAVVAVALAGVAISVLATLYPAYVAARTRPVDGLRNE